MPTKRTPVNRQHASSIATVLPLFQHALKARAKWRRSGSDEDFEANAEAQKAVERALKIKMWEVSIWDIDDIYSRTKPPEEARQRDSWARALELRQALETADREHRRAEREGRQAAKATPEPEPETAPLSSSPDQPSP
jgi:hypothetical protein